MIQSVRELIKKFVFRYTQIGAPKYQYNIEPIQLAEIIFAVSQTKILNRTSTLVEVGVARGLTSRLIAEHVRLSKLDARLYCIDTFSSFSKIDIEYEVKHRGKRVSELVGFSYNDFDVWRKNFLDFEFVIPIKADASSFDFSSIAPLDVLFLDVDLYLPTLSVLRHAYPFMSPTGVIIVDDVQDNNQWDGAYQAFMEFVDSEKLCYRLSGNKCGIIDMQSNRADRAAQ